MRTKSITMHGCSTREMKIPISVAQKIIYRDLFIEGSKGFILLSSSDSTETGAITLIAIVVTKVGLQLVGLATCENFRHSRISVMVVAIRTPLNSINVHSDGNVVIFGTASHQQECYYRGRQRTGCSISSRFPSGRMGSTSLGGSPPQG